MAAYQKKESICLTLGLAIFVSGCEDEPQRRRLSPLEEINLQMSAWQRSCLGVRAGRWSEPDFVERLRGLSQSDAQVMDALALVDRDPDLRKRQTLYAVARMVAYVGGVYRMAISTPGPERYPYRNIPPRVTYPQDFELCAKFPALQISTP